VRTPGFRAEHKSKRFGLGNDAFGRTSPRGHHNGRWCGFQGEILTPPTKAFFLGPLREGRLGLAFISLRPARPEHGMIDTSPRLPSAPFHSGDIFLFYRAGMYYKVIVDIPLSGSLLLFILFVGRDMPELPPPSTEISSIREASKLRVK